MKREKGLTLVQLMFIVALISIIIVIVIPVVFRYQESQKAKAQKQSFMLALKQKQGLVEITDILFDGVDTDDAGNKRTYYMLEATDKYIRLPIDEFAVDKTTGVSFVELITKDETAKARYKLTFSAEDLLAIVTPFLMERGVYNVFVSNYSLIFKDN